MPRDQKVEFNNLEHLKEGSSKSTKRQQTPKRQTEKSESSRWSKYRTPRKSDLSDEDAEYRQKSVSMGIIKIEGESRKTYTIKREDPSHSRSCPSTETRIATLKAEMSGETETPPAGNRKRNLAYNDTSDDESQRSFTERDIKKKKAKRALISSEDDKDGDDVVFVVEKKTSITRNGLKAILREEDRAEDQKIKKLETEIEALKKENEKLKNDQKGLEAFSKTLSETVDGNEKKQCDALNKALEDTLACSVCSEVFIDAKVTNCGHLFCDYCLTKWLKTNRTCPLCREDIGEGTSVEAINEAVVRLTMLMTNEGAIKRFNLIEERKTEMERLQNEPTPPRSPYHFGFGSGDEGLFRMIAELSGGISNDTFSDSNSVVSQGSFRREGLPQYRREYFSSDSQDSLSDDDDMPHFIDEYHTVQDSIPPILSPDVPSSPSDAGHAGSLTPVYFSSDEEFERSLDGSQIPAGGFSPASVHSPTPNASDNSDDEEVWLSGDSHIVDHPNVIEEDQLIEPDQAIYYQDDEQEEEDDGGDEEEEGNYEEEDYGEEEDSVRASPNYSPYMDELDEIEHFGDDEANDSYGGEYY